MRRTDELDALRVVLVLAKVEKKHEVTISSKRRVDPLKAIHDPVSC